MTVVANFAFGVYLLQDSLLAHCFCRSRQLENIVEIARALRRAYTRRRRPRTLIPLLLIVLLTSAVGVLGYFKVPLIPKTPVPPLVELKAEP